VPTSKLYFVVSLEVNNANGNGRFQTITYELIPGLELGQWYHVVATYNRTNMTLALNGDRVLSRPACDGLDCGSIVYSGLQNCWSTTSFVVGAFANSLADSADPHFGAMKSFRVFQRALTPAEERILSAHGVLGEGNGWECQLTEYGLLHGRWRMQGDDEWKVRTGTVVEVEI
jgi:hypothetical protein